MKYMLLIQHGDTPTPGSPEWEAMSEDEKKGVATGYQAINQTGGVTPECGWSRPMPRRRSALRTARR